MCNFSGCLAADEGSPAETSCTFNVYAPSSRLLNMKSIFISGSVIASCFLGWKFEMLVIMVIRMHFKF